MRRGRLAAGTRLVAGHARRRGARRVVSPERGPTTLVARSQPISAVSVPVLSVHTTDVEPSVSTAGSSRTTARRRAIRCTPMASAIVTIAGNPSGIAATARVMAARAASANGKPRTAAPRRAAPPRPPIDDRDASTRAERARGSAGSRRLDPPSRPEMRPSSVRSPVATATASPCRPRRACRRAAVVARPAASGRRPGPRPCPPARLAGQRRLVRAQPAAPAGSAGRPRRALPRATHHVPGHEGLGGSLRSTPVAAHTSPARTPARQRRDRPAGPVLLGEADQRVEDHDREHDRAVLDVANANATAAEASSA